MAEPQDWREVRRLRAWELKQEGWSQARIAQALGVTPGAVSQWMKRVAAGGGAALRRRVAPGPRPKLTAEQRARLPDLLARGAEAYGFAGDVWTTKRVAAVIEREFGVRYHPAHVSRLLRAVGWSVQQPVTRATQRDEDAITAWYRDRWPTLRKKAKAAGQTIVWVDESAFYLLPAAVRTYAPRGQTPVLRVPLTRDHLSVISAITLDERLFLRVQERALRGPDVVRFLRHLLCQVPGKVLVIWDGAPIHRGHDVADFLATREAARLEVERLPGYAPELNPDEGIWNHLKRVELRNRCCRTLTDLRLALRQAAARLRHKRPVLQACVHHAGYHV
jgi:transposase